MPAQSPVERAVVRILQHKSRRAEFHDWIIVGKALVQGDLPGRKEDTFESFTLSDGHIVYVQSRNRSEAGEPCALYEVGVGTKWDSIDNPWRLARILSEGPGPNPKISVVGSPGWHVAIPFNRNSPILSGDRLTAAGWGSWGSMRPSPILQMWKRTAEGWRLVQTEGKERFSGNAYWAQRDGRVDSTHFVMEIAVDTELTEGGAPWWTHSMRVQHWIYRDGRYRLLAQHWVDDAMRPAERFLIAIKHRRLMEARNLAPPALVSAAEMYCYKTPNWPYRIDHLWRDTVDLYDNAARDHPPMRLWFVRAGTGWKLREIIPRYTGPGTEWSWAILEERAIAQNKPHVSYPYAPTRLAPRRVTERLRAGA